MSCAVYAAGGGWGNKAPATQTAGDKAMEGAKGGWGGKPNRGQAEGGRTNSAGGWGSC